MVRVPVSGARLLSRRTVIAVNFPSTVMPCASRGLTLCLNRVIRGLRVVTIRLLVLGVDSTVT